MPAAKLHNTRRTRDCSAAYTLRTFGPRCPYWAEGLVRHLASIRSSTVAVTALIGSLACASTGSSVDNQPQTNITTRQLSSPGSRPIETTDVSSADFVPVKGSPADAMTALTQIYGQLKIPIGIMNTGAGQIGTQNLRVPSHRIGTRMLSDYLNCGQESMTGSRADLDDVTITTMTTVRQDRDSTTVVGTQVSGWARPTGTSSNGVDCQSTGELERTIATKLQSTLGTPVAKTN
jgi:hypothetical protein